MFEEYMITSFASEVLLEYIYNYEFQNQVDEILKNVISAKVDGEEATMWGKKMSLQCALTDIAKKRIKQFHSELDD